MNALLFLWLLLTPTARSEEVVAGLEVLGSPEFVQASRRALKVLEGQRSYEKVRSHLGRLKEVPKAEDRGMDVYQDKPTFLVDPGTWGHSDNWYASCIVHDGCHARAYHDAKAAHGREPDPAEWTGLKAEQLCVDEQLDLLTSLRFVDRNLIDYLRRLRTVGVHDGRGIILPGRH